MRIGPAGAQFVQTHAIKTSNDTFNVVLTLVCAMASWTDGATIAMLPGQDSPLNCVAVMVGFHQARKSRMTGLLHKVATEIHRHVRDCPGETRRHGNDCQCGADCDGRGAKFLSTCFFRR